MSRRAKRRAGTRTADAGPRRAEDLAYAVPMAEAARLLGVCTRTVQRLVEGGHLKPFYLPHSGRPRLPLDEILAVRRNRTRPKTRRLRPKVRR